MTFKHVALVSLVAGTTLIVSCRDDEVGQLLGGVAGQVCNPLTGRPAPGAIVTAKYFNEVTDKDDEKSETADDNGFFKIGGLPEKAVELVIKGGEEFQSTIP